MALGGGTFVVQNKKLPGAYINFVSAASASATLSERGIATMPLELDWGVEGEVFEVTNEDFQKNSLKLFGYAFDSPKMLGLNEHQNPLCVQADFRGYKGKQYFRRSPLFRRSWQ